MTYPTVDDVAEAFAGVESFGRAVEELGISHTLDIAPQILDVREAMYGEAWLMTGEALATYSSRLTRILETPYGFAWIMILNKLHRLMQTPTHADSWIDIQGYAQLVREHLATQEESNE